MNRYLVFDDEARKSYSLVGFDVDSAVRRAEELLQRKIHVSCWFIGT